MNSAADDTMAALINAGYTSGSIADRQRLALLAKSGLSVGSSADLQRASSLTVRELMKSTDVFNPFKQWRTVAVPGMQAKNRLAKTLWIGDSIWEGQGASAKTNRLQDKFLAATRTRYSLPAGGAGYIPSYYSTTGVSVWTPATTTTGTQGTLEQGAHHVTLAVGQYIEYANLTATSVDAITRDGTATTGTYTTLINGVAGPSIDTSLASGVSRIHHLPLGAHSTYTVRFTASVATCYFGGLVVYDGDESSGVSNWDCSHTSYASGNFGTDQSLGWANYAPDLVMWDLYNNDFLQTGTAPSVAASRANAFLNLIPGTPTLVCLIPYDVPALQGTSAGGTGFTFQQYIDAMTTMILARGGVMFSLRKYYNPVSGTLIAADGVHPSDAGHAAFASTLDQFLAGDIQ
jgi:hypothetical protein